MAFFRRRGNSLTLLHGIRTSSGVRQRVLHTFSNLAELQRLLDIGGWPKFCHGDGTEVPEVAPDWEDVHRQALALEATATLPEPDPLDRFDKLRRALAYAGRELGFLNPDQDGHRQMVLALGPELKNCLYYGQIALDRVRGKDHEMAQEFAGYWFPIQSWCRLWSSRLADFWLDEIGRVPPSCSRRPAAMIPLTRISIIPKASAG